jgi:predicted helicase
MNPKLIIEKSKNWSDFVNNLEKLGSNASHNKLKGDCFELVTKLWLLTNPLYINKLKNVWIHSEIPQSIIDKLQLAQPEVGIDIIAELDNGKYLAIQCKYHTDPDINVGYSEASTFFFYD